MGELVGGGGGRADRGMGGWVAAWTDGYMDSSEGGWMGHLIHCFSSSQHL